MRLKEELWVVSCRYRGMHIGDPTTEISRWIWYEMVVKKERLGIRTDLFNAENSLVTQMEIERIRWMYFFIRS